MKKGLLNIISSVILLVSATSALAQTENSIQLLSEAPAVQKTVQDFLNARNAQTYNAMTTSNVLAPDDAQTPTVALILNRKNFKVDQMFQASLYVLPSANNQQVEVNTLMIHLETADIKNVRSSFTRLTPDKNIPLQNYIFDGSEKTGLYIYLVTLFDSNHRQLAGIASDFVYQFFVNHDKRGFSRLDSAEKQGRYLYLKGAFPAPNSKLKQMILIGGKTFPIIRSGDSQATVDLGEKLELMPSIYDITLLVWSPFPEYAYDSNTLPGGLNIQMPIPNQIGGVTF